MNYPKAFSAADGLVISPMNWADTSKKSRTTTIDDLKMPLIRLCFYDKVLCYDHAEKTF